MVVCFPLRYRIEGLGGVGVEWVEGGRENCKKVAPSPPLEVKAKRRSWVKGRGEGGRLSVVWPLGSVWVVR